MRAAPRATPFPYTTLFRSRAADASERALGPSHLQVSEALLLLAEVLLVKKKPQKARPLFERVVKIREHRYGKKHAQLIDGLRRSEEHTSELQSLRHLVCRL